MGKIKNRVLPYLPVLVFIVAETIIYSLFMAQDIKGTGDGITLKYIGILLCVVFSASAIFFARRDAVLLTVALVFTAISDYFLLVLGDCFEVGLVTFIVAQTVYAVRIYFIRKKFSFPLLIARIVLPVVLIVTLVILSMLDFLTALACIYFPLLLLNAIEAGFTINANKRNLLFFIGLLLFICCDICVGLDNFAPVLGITLPKAITDFTRVGMWGFYLPSQVLITLSVRKD